MAEAAEELRVHKDQAKTLEENIKSLQTEVISILDEHEQKTFRYETEEARVTVSRVQVEKLIIDAPGLHKELGSKMWPKVSTRQLDEEKLMARISTGEIKKTVVSKHSSEHKNAPFIRFNRREK